MVKKFHKVEVVFVKRKKRSYNKKGLTQRKKRRYNKKGLTHRKKLGPKSHLRHA